MKKIVSMFAMLFCMSTVFAQKQQKVTVDTYYEFLGDTAIVVTTIGQGANNNGDSLHRAANVFVDAVAKVAKEHFPVEFDGWPTHEITEVKGLMRLTYSITLVKTDSISGILHVDHRGALSWDADLKKAKVDSRARCKAQFEVAGGKLLKAFGDNHHFIWPEQSPSLFRNKGYWVLTESFFTFATPFKK